MDIVRYFLVTYYFCNDRKTGFGNLRIKNKTFPNNIFLKKEASKNKEFDTEDYDKNIFTTSDVVITNIFEFNTKEDFNNFN